MRFDSSRAWDEASRAVAANRDMLLALAGVFMVLPAAILTLLVPQPEMPSGITAREMFETLSAFYRQHWLELLVAALVHIVGSLAMLALITDRTRPTVGQTIALGAVAAPSVIVAQILIGFALGAAILVPMTLAGMTGLPALVMLVMLLSAAGLVYVMARMSLVSPAVIVERQRSPIAAMARSWQLTRGNAGRLLTFFLLLGIAFLVIMLIAGMVGGLLARLVGGANFAELADALIAAICQAAMSVYFVAAIAATHRQLTEADRV